MQTSVLFTKDIEEAGRCIRKSGVEKIERDKEELARITLAKRNYAIYMFTTAFLKIADPSMRALAVTNTFAFLTSCQLGLGDIPQALSAKVRPLVSDA